MFRGYGEDRGSAAPVLDSGEPIDLLFTDVFLGPGPSGRELADTFAARGARVPVLFTTGFSRNAIVHHGRLDPGVHLLEKPYTDRELARRIRALLDATPGTG